MIAFFEKYYPHSTELYVTSGMDGDHGAVSHHYGLSYNGSPTAAIDFGGYDDPEPTDKDQRDMGLAADWLFDNFWDLTVELIHTQPHNDHETYVRSQARVRPYATADHVNHIHWATSADLMNRIEERARATWGDGPAVPGGPDTPTILVGVDHNFGLPDGHYWGLIDGPAESHGGFFAAERPVVKLIQERLQASGFAPKTAGWADGIFEEPTASAVRSFQSANGLAVDGRVGRLTWHKLFASETTGQAGPTPTGTLFGCDIYDFTVNAGLTADHIRGFVHSGGLAFINAKFWEQDSDGSTFPHMKAAAMLRAATEAGLQFPCAFVVPRSGVSPQVTVGNLIAFADNNFPMWRHHPGFFWQVDTEFWFDGVDPEPYDKVGIGLGAEVAQHLMRMSQKPAILYAPKWAYGDSVPNYPGRRLWASNYSGSGASRDYHEMYLGDNAPGWSSYSGVVPTINQFCSDGKVNGWGPLAMSAFRGTVDDFRKMLSDTLAPHAAAVDGVPAPAMAAGRFNGNGLRAKKTLVSAVMVKH